LPQVLKGTILHRTDRRIKAHILISHLALLLLCILKRTLREKNINLSPSDAIEKVGTIRERMQEEFLSASP